MKSNWKVASLIIVALCAVATATAQDTAPLPPSLSIGVGGAIAGPAAGGFFEFNISNADEIVKGVPFSAKQVTKQRQTFADGNEIVRSSASALYRDSQGRMRRELAISLPGGGAVAGDVGKIVTINDPVAGYLITLDTEHKTANKIVLPRFEPAKLPLPGEKNKDVIFIASSGGAGAISDAPQSTDLGDRSIGGVTARGTRLTTTIEPKRIGNTNGITIISERWHSPELKLDLRTVHKDPWVGQIEMTLEDLLRGEPDESLFKIPAGYKVTDASAGQPFEIHIAHPEQEQ